MHKQIETVGLDLRTNSCDLVSKMRCYLSRETVSFRNWKVGNA